MQYLMIGWVIMGLLYYRTRLNFNQGLFLRGGSTIVCAFNDLIQNLIRCALGT